MADYMKFNSSGISEMKDFFQALEKPPVVAIGKLEKLLSATFAATQAATHIITTSLKQSGKVESDFDGAHWEGSIEYGGDSTGPINPVDYAIYEMARGGDHNFLAPAEAAEPAFEAIIAEYFPDEVGK